jgi:Transposase IS4
VGFSAVVQAKKKTVLKLISTYGSAKAVDYEQRRRKPTEKGVNVRYTIKAPEAQALYNKNKGVIDQFNRYRLQYFRLGRDNNDAVKYVRFFLSAWTVNAYLHFLAVNSADSGSLTITQLDYRIEIINWFLERIGMGPEVAVPRVSLDVLHWPLQAQFKKNCTYKTSGVRCQNKSTTYCQGCGPNVRYCGVHLRDFHVNLPQVRSLHM